MIASLVLATLIAGDDPARPHVSVEGRYSVKFPKPPKVESKELAVGNGVTVPVVTAKADGKDGLVFAVVYADYPPELNVPAAKLLAGARDGLKGKDGVIVRDKATEFGDDKLLAREVTIEAGRNAKNAVRALLIVSGGRLYQVMVSGPKAAVEKTPVDEFLKSFELNK